MATVSSSQPSRSLANRFEVMLLDLKEKYGERRSSQEATKQTFQLLDDLIPHFGIFQRVSLMIRDRLFDAVYSDELTASESSPEIEKIPYFVLVNRMEAIKEEALQELRETIQEKIASLDALKRELGTKRSEIERLSKEMRGDRKKIAEMMAEMKKLIVENDKLARTVSHQQRTQQRMAIDMDSRMKQIKNSYGNLAVEAEILGQYKSAYDSLDKAFCQYNPTIPENQSTESLDLLFAEENLEMTAAVEKQLLALQNTMIEEYDLKVEEHKQNLQFEIMMDEAEWDQLTASKRKFIFRSAELKAELKKIQGEMTRLKREISKLKKFKKSRKITPHLSLVEDEEVNNDEYEDDEEEGRGYVDPSMDDPFYSRLWGDWKSRNELPRKVPRQLSLDRCSSLAHQFYASLLWEDEFGSASDPALSLLDSFYSFLSDRYFDPDVVHLASYDAISSLIKYSSNDLSLQLLVAQLCGQLDAVCLRYILLMSDFIDHVEWESPKDFLPFSTVVYPFLSEDDLEQMSMSFIAFSENKVSKHLVCNFFTYFILKHREPRFVEAESRLLQHPGERSGLLNEIEFMEAVENILPSTPEGIRRRLFAQSEADMPRGLDAVPIARLSQIVAYLGLLQLAPLIRTSISDKVIEGRTHQAMSAAASSIVSSRDAAGGGQAFTFVTLAGLKTVAKQLIRWSRNR